jgi:hypothetical protein
MTETKSKLPPALQDALDRKNAAAAQLAAGNAGTSGAGEPVASGVAAGATQLTPGIPVEQVNQPVATNAVLKPAAVEVAKVETRRYQFPSAPSSFLMPNGRRLEAHDGVLETSDPEVIHEMEAAVQCGNVRYADGHTYGRFERPVLQEDRIVAGLNGQSQVRN